MKGLKPYSIKLSYFYKKKSAMVETMHEQLYKWQGLGKSITHVRLDNVGENIYFEERYESMDWKLVLQWEFTSRNTLQQNSIAEEAFWTIRHQGIAMMVWTIVAKEVQFMVYGQAFDTASKWDGWIPITIDGTQNQDMSIGWGTSRFHKSHVNMGRRRYSDLYSRYMCQIGR